jgi:hypothetical protein
VTASPDVSGPLSGGLVVTATGTPGGGGQDTQYARVGAVRNAVPPAAAYCTVTRPRIPDVGDP